MDHEEELDGVTKEYALKEHQMSRDIQSQSERLEQGAKELSAMTEQLEALKGTFAEYQRDSEKRDKVFNPQRPRPPEFRSGVPRSTPGVRGGGGRVMRTRDPRSGGAQRDNAWRSEAPGPHPHGNAATQVVDDRRAEVHGQQKPSNDPRNNQHNPRYANYWAR